MGHLGMSHFRKKEGVFRGAATGVRCVLGHTHAPAHIRSSVQGGAHGATLEKMLPHNNYNKWNKWVPRTLSGFRNRARRPNFLPHFYPKLE